MDLENIAIKGTSNMLLPDCIFTERLIIRNMSLDDVDEVWHIWRNSDNEKYMKDPVESVEEIITICLNSKNSNGYLTVVSLKGTDEIIGTCCFGPTNNKNEWGFGYSIKQSFWGSGYATEIVRAVINYGSSLEITDFISACAIENSASGKVLEKIGMQVDHKSSFKQPKTNVVYESHIYRLHVD